MTSAWESKGEKGRTKGRNARAQAAATRSWPVAETPEGPAASLSYDWHCSKHLQWIHDTPLLRASANTAVREGMCSGTVARCVATTLLTMSKSTLGPGAALSLRPRAARYQSPRAMTAICTRRPADSLWAVGALGSWKQAWHPAVCMALCLSATRLPT